MAKNYAIALGGISCFLQLLDSNYLNGEFHNDLVLKTLQRSWHKQEINKLASPTYLAHYFLDLIKRPNLIINGIKIGKDFHDKSELIIDLPIVLKQLRTNDLDFNDEILKKSLKNHPRYLNYGTSFEFGTTRKVFFFEIEPPKEEIKPIKIYTHN